MLNQSVYQYNASMTFPTIQLTNKSKTSEKIITSLGEMIKSVKHLRPVE